MNNKTIENNLSILENNQITLKNGLSIVENNLEKDPFTLRNDLIVLMNKPNIELIHISRFSKEIKQYQYIDYILIKDNESKMYSTKKVTPVELYILLKQIKSFLRIQKPSYHPWKSYISECYNPFVIPKWYSKIQSSNLKKPNESISTNDSSSILILSFFKEIFKSEYNFFLSWLSLLIQHPGYIHDHIIILNNLREDYRNLLIKIICLLLDSEFNYIKINKIKDLNYLDSSNKVKKGKIKNWSVFCYSDVLDQKEYTHIRRCVNKFYLTYNSFILFTNCVYKKCKYDPVFKFIEGLDNDSNSLDNGLNNDSNGLSVVLNDEVLLNLFNYLYNYEINYSLVSIENFYSIFN